MKEDVILWWNLQVMWPVFHEIVGVFLLGFCGLANKIFSELILGAFCLVNISTAAFMT